MMSSSFGGGRPCRPFLSLCPQRGKIVRPTAKRPAMVCGSSLACAPCGYCEVHVRSAPRSMMLLVLILMTSAVVLTECGMVPALLGLLSAGQHLNVVERRPLREACLRRPLRGASLFSCPPFFCFLDFVTFGSFFSIIRLNLLIKYTLF